MRVPALIGTFTVQEGDLDAPFWSGLAAGELRLQRCASCGTWIWGPQWRCGGCGSWDLSWAAVAPRGRVYSWTRTWHPVTPDLACAVPYTVVLVAVEGAAGRRVLGVWAPADDPVLGEAVEVAWPVPGEARANPYALVWQRPGGKA